MSTAYDGATVTQNDGDRSVCCRHVQICAEGRFWRERTPKNRQQNGVSWSVRAIKPISVGPDHCIAESVIMQPFAQTGPVGIPNACERRC